MHLKKYRRAEGGAKILGGEKSRFYAKKSYFFQFLGGGCRVHPPPGSAPAWPLYKTAKTHIHQTRRRWCNFFVEFNLQLWFVVTIVIVQMCLAFKKGLSRSLDLDSTYFIVNYITFGSDTSYSNLQRSSTNHYKRDHLT